MPFSGGALSDATGGLSLRVHLDAPPLWIAGGLTQELGAKSLVCAFVACSVLLRK